MFPRLGWIRGLCGLAMLTLACRPSALQGCTRALDAERWREAARLCDAAWAESKDPRAGAASARAWANLGQGDRALAWVERLRGTASEPGLWSVAGAIYHQRGETDRAAQAFRRDLDLLAPTGDRVRASRAHYGLYFLAWEGSRYREALEEARLAFTSAREAGDRGLQARAAQALYSVLYALGDLAGARRALDLAARLLPPERSIDRARLLNNRGILSLDEGRPELARHELGEALALLNGTGEDPLLARSAALNLVQASLDRGDLDVAERHLATALRHADPDDNSALLFYRARLARARQRPEAAAGFLREALAADPVPGWAWELEDERGRLAEASGDPRAAEQAYERSAAILEEMRRSLGFDELKAWLLDRKRQPFESLFRLQARSGRSPQALATVERAKARTFQDAFIHAAAASGPSSPRGPWTAAADRADALRDLLPAMSESPAVALAPVDRTVAALRGVRALVYFEAGDELWLLDVTGGRVRPLRLGLSPARARELVEAHGAPDDPAAAEALGDLLLPAELRLKPGSTLYILPDGALTRLSFASLRQGGRWLVEDHTVVYVPGLSALAASAGAARGAAAPPVVLADPRGDLPEAAAEGREVARLLGIAPRLGSAASAEALKAASAARVLHIAGHAGWGPGGPWIELADRRLSPAAILAARVRPRLVVLASCASASGEGRGLWGSPGAAFLAAGSGAVLATLGSVEDRTAREFVLRFYQEGGAADPAGALARAQRFFLASGRAPSFWAPFVLLATNRS